MPSIYEAINYSSNEVINHCLFYNNIQFQIDICIASNKLRAFRLSQTNNIVFILIFTCLSS